MASAQQLRSNADRLRTQAEAKQRDAGRASQKATSYSTGGDLASAKSQNDIAIRLQQEAGSLLEQASTIEQQALDIERQIQELEKRKTDLQASTQTEIGRLDSQINALR